MSNEQDGPSEPETVAKQIEIIRSRHDASIKEQERRLAELEQRQRDRDAALKNSNYSINFDKKAAFTVDENTLAHVERSFKEFGKDGFSISVNFVGEHSVSFNSLEALLADPILRNRPIKSIRISTSNNDLFRRASINMTASRSSPVDYSISGDRPACVQLEGELREELNSSKSWYDWFYRYEFVRFMLQTLLFFLLVTLLLRIRYDDNTAIAAGFTLSTIASIPLELLIVYLHPSLQLNIGRSRKEADFRRSLRRFIGGGLLLGTAVVFLQQWLLNRAGM